MQSPLISEDNKSKMKSTSENLQSGAQSAVDAASNTGERAASALKSGTEQLSKQASAALSSAADVGSRAIETSTQTANQLTAALADNVKSNPIATLAAAMGFGFLLGVLTSR